MSENAVPSNTLMMVKKETVLMNEREKKTNKDDLMVFHPNTIQSMNEMIVDSQSMKVSILHILVSQMLSSGSSS